MIKIIQPTHYKKIPWKNGKGETIELAINDGGTIDHFDWRISMAGVVENGPFSDFTGFMRNLVLIEGDGVDLIHGNGQTDRLNHLLSMATFDGGCQTAAVLKSGPITDFNVMTNKESYTTIVSTHPATCEILLNRCDHCFIYGLNQPLQLSYLNKALDEAEKHVLPTAHLMQISDENMEGFVVTGELMIIIYLSRL